MVNVNVPENFGGSFTRSDRAQRVGLGLLRRQLFKRQRYPLTVRSYHLQLPGRHYLPPFLKKEHNNLNNFEFKFPAEGTGEECQKFD